MLPDQVERAGFRRLLFLGDAIRVPTTGLAFASNLLLDDRELVETMLNCYRKALQCLRHDRQALSESITRYLGFSGDDLESACRLLLACYSQDGRFDVARTKASIELVSQETGLDQSPDVEPLYDLNQ